MQLNQALISDLDYTKGRDACRRGEKATANPHQPDAKEHGRWRDGWIDQALLEIEEQDNS